VLDHKFVDNHHQRSTDFVTHKFQERRTLGRGALRGIDVLHLMSRYKYHWECEQVGILNIDFISVIPFIGLEQ
jgi:hypothetical protein